MQALKARKNISHAASLLWMGIVLLGYSLTGCSLLGDDDGDKTAPTFAGIQQIEITESGSVRISWEPATDASLPITYEVFHTNTSGAEKFNFVPLSSIEDSSEITISGLHPGAGLAHYFVARARDAKGNRDSNIVEVSTIFQANGVQLLGQYEMDTAADLDVDNARDLAFISQWHDEGVSIVDLSANKENPTLLATLDNIGYNADVQVKGDYLYIAHEQRGRGIDIYDISDPENPSLVKKVGPNTGYPFGLEDCHNLWLQPDRDLLYCASSANGNVEILSIGENGVGSPTAPSHLASLSLNGDWGVHDVYAKDELLYVGFLDAGFAIYNITDPSSPVLQAQKSYEDAFCHNVWPSTDGQYLFSTDEIPEGHLRIWDISDFGNISQVASYQPNENAIIHNVEVVDDHAYISYYTEGLKIINISDPINPVEVGSFDIFEGSDAAGMEGAWGVEAIPPHVYVSGSNSGLWVFRFEEPAIGPPIQ